MDALLQRLVESQTKSNDAITALTTAMQNMAAAQQATPAVPAANVTANVTTTSKAEMWKLIPKPTAFKGKTDSAGARKFLASFILWARDTQEAMNTLDTTTNIWVPDEPKWIRAVLNLMEDEAGAWAAPYIEMLVRLEKAFEDKWEKFDEAFGARFCAVDEAQEAKDKLAALWQGSLSVPDYAAKFQQYAKRTGLSDADLVDKFYAHLTDVVKDALSGTVLPRKTLVEIIASTTQLDVRLRQRAAEKKGKASQGGCSLVKAI